MKYAKNRLQPEILYILGAGASHALSHVKRKDKQAQRKVTPLDGDFISRLNRHFQEQKNWRGTSTRLIKGNWLYRASDFEKNKLEQAIITRISQYDFFSRVQPQRISGKIANDEYLYHLSCLICDYLKFCEINQPKKAEEFLAHVFPQGEGVASNNRIITFNYDSLLDDLLIKRGVSLQDLYFSSILEKRPSSSAVSISEEVGNPLILKLHGSVNWRCEYKFFREMISGDASKTNGMPIWHNDAHVNPNKKEEEREFSPLIIPPVPDKPITDIGIFKSMWERAYEYMYDAKYIVIVGYSCPETDVFARVMFANFAAYSDKLKRITVVDPDATALKNYRDMINAKPNVKWHYFSGFSEYIDSL